MKEIHEIKGEPFPYKNLFDMPHEVYKPYEDECRNILANLGGKEFLEGAADRLMSQIM